MTDTNIDTYEIEIERFADQGRCVGHLDGRVVFVRFALPGERVRIVLDEPHERDDRFWTGEVVEVLHASPLRVDPAWPLAGPVAWDGGVGGADLVHVSLDGQLEWKKAVIEDQMSRLGGVDVDVDVLRVRGDEESKGLGWRTRIEMVADDNGFASMRRRGSHTRVALDSMPLATKALAAIAEKTNVWKGGFEPGAKIRLAVPEPAEGQGAGENFALSVDGTLRAGSERLIETVAGAGRNGHSQDYDIEESGFWQVHRAAPQTLVAEVLRAVDRYGDGAPKVVWDLYSGSGLFTVALGNHFDREGRGLFSVEGAPHAVHSARMNLTADGLERAVTKHGDVSRTLRSVPPRYSRPDIVVLDPPRAGAKKNVCLQVSRAKTPLVIYVACDPTSLARDTKTLLGEGYEIVHIQAYDIYPMTHHVETVAVFRRA
ncbi:MAG: TRAM domain-containing protein [Bifidobacteriaceae bacterium]|jgi:tRNA/tmRNA/rRNA uracil-C5-methylase (TrmA/RlmC/RlmD family)|nr:TRAM domain-containing protein [Bifidobacteriaceae bacterium]